MSNYVNITNGTDVILIVRNLVTDDFLVAQGYTQMYPNMTLAEGVTVTIEEDGELQVT